MVAVSLHTMDSRGLGLITRRGLVVCGFLLFPACAPPIQKQEGMPVVAVPPSSICRPAKSLAPISVDACCGGEGGRCRGVSVRAWVAASGKVSKIAVTGSEDPSVVSCVESVVEKAPLAPARLCLSEELIGSEWSMDLTPKPNVP